MPTLMPTIRQPSTTSNVSSSLTHKRLQGFPPSVRECLPSGVCVACLCNIPTVQRSCSTARGAYNYHQHHSSFAQSHYNGSQAFVGQRKSLNSAMRALSLSEQVPPAPTGVVQSSSSVPSALTFQNTSYLPPAQVSSARRDSRWDRSVKSSPYHSTRTLSLPVQSVSHKEEVVQTCQWVGDDGTACGAQITPTSVPQHLITHGVKKLTHDHRLPCRWLGCRLKGDKGEMNRESIVRHVREKHMGCKRTL